MEPMEQYLEPDPEFPLPIFDFTPCNDEDVLERFRISNETYRTEWASDGGEW